MINERFDSILNKCLKSGGKYRDSLPKGPPAKYPVLSDAVLRSLQLTEHGEDISADRGHAYQDIALVDDDAKPITISMPDENDLAGLHVCGIDGNYQRVSKSAFEFILARACIIAFRYSKTGEKPYFYCKVKNSSAVVWIDGNIFEEKVSFHTEALPKDKDGILDALTNSERPFMLRYERGDTKDTPSSHARALAFQIQQSLELLCLKNTPKDKKKPMVCIKNGPLFSISMFAKDTISGLAPIFSWSDKQILIACSRFPTESTLLLEALLNQRMGETLKEIWFDKPKALDPTIKNWASDINLLPRILRPGQRTPLLRAVPVQRAPIVEAEKGLTPLSCYYRSRCYPHNCIRMEIPLFMWNKSRDAVNYAIKIAAWQHDLGHTAPLVRLEAQKQCDLSVERDMLQLQTDNALNRNELYFMENYNE